MPLRRDISGTDKGNIQIFDPVRKTLRIVVHQGLGRRLVEHFREDGWDASCGEAAKQVQRLVVQDVAQLDGLQGTPGLEIVLEDGIRSIQCTPLLSRDGRLLGMLNNHYRWPGGPTPQALRYIDLLARQAAELVERHQAESELADERRRKDEFLACWPTSCATRWRPCATWWRSRSGPRATGRSRARRAR